MADGRKNQSSSMKPEYLCCLGCCLGMIVGVVMLIGGVGFEGGVNDESLQNISEQTCKDNCYEKHGEENNDTGYNGIACLAIGSNQFSPEIRAFLRAITNSESRGDFESYYELYGSTICPDNNYCSNFDRNNPIHPSVAEANLGYRNCHGDYCSGAFGRFQFMPATWTSWAQQANVPIVKNGTNSEGEAYYNISPKYQDIATATELISRGTETKLKNNDLEGAINQNNGTWTSLPGGSQLNSKTEEFRNIYNKLLAEEKKGCGQKTNQSNNNIKVAPSGPNDFGIKEVPYINQGQFTDYNIANMGCGQTSTTMVINYITGKKMTPPQFAAKWGYSLREGLATETKKTITDTDFDSSNPAQSWKNIFAQINKYNPVIIGTGFSEGLGHIMVIVGYQKDSTGNVKYVYVNDPAGDHGTTYNGTYVSSNGFFAKYEINDFTRHLTTEKHEDGSFIYYVNDFSRSSNNNTANTSSSTTQSTSDDKNDDLDTCLKRCEEQSQSNQPDDGTKYSDDCRLFPLSSLKKNNLLSQITPGSGREFLAQRDYSETCGKYRTHKGNDLLIPADSSTNYPVRAIESGTVSQIIEQFIDCGQGWTSYILIKNDTGLYNG
jgi:muramidase (phage lysozyme)/predicted double-glycine peptidase